jgi:hypothetical protein
MGEKEETSMLGELSRHSRDKYSQNGEDGILEFIFSEIGVGNRLLFEVGAHDGVTHSHTRALVEKGWTAHLFEAMPERAEKIPASPSTHVYVERVGWENGDKLDNYTPQDYDLLSIDVDGNDYHIWDAVTAQPRVVIVEFNPTFPNNVSFVQAPEHKINHGSSLLAMADLGESKGYKLACVCGVNAIFVRDDIEIDIGPNELDDLFDPIVTTMCQLYDGTILLVGNGQMLWHNVQLHPTNDVQVLPYHARRFSLDDHP